MVALTEKATSAIRRLIENNESGALGLRVMVEQGGCSGLQYMLGLEIEASAGDEIYDFDGVKVFVDPESLPIVDGMRIDFVESLEKSGFVFDNPKAADVCSCGRSFAA
jgi:iron-sulfur cluster assembly accessory protein